MTGFTAPTTFNSPSGAKLTLYSMAAEGEARGAIHINHGLAEHAARYGDFAAFLSTRGYHVYAHDHRGHGHTEAPETPARQFGGWDKVMDDAAAVNAMIHKAHPNLPVIVFGHSMGGVIALNHLMRAPQSVSAAAIWNANAALGPLTMLMKGLLALEGLVGGGSKPSALMNALTFTAWNKRFKPNRTEFDWLSRDEDAVDAYVADPDCGWPAPVSLWKDFVTGMDFAGSSGPLQAIPNAMPVQLLGGGHDPATDSGKTMKTLSRRMTRAGLENVETHILPQTRHESLNEINRMDAYELFADWAGRVTA